MITPTAVSRRACILFPIVVTLLIGLLIPDAAR
jgi:Na+-transporting methylmalonyl-CoA/oxaloacetate decarboxylase beta subunit